ncbi:MAG: malto-oligosyltrehalose synthase [Verrucomicrobia bacterium]|nr:malto-oligosyltrehalose synthase [Verrucomicrobiota bacterium]
MPRSSDQPTHRVGFLPPAATYRLQFNAGFRFEDATRISDYLHDLGVSDVYASPIFKARSGSTHGYDICDFNQLNPEVGTEPQFEQLSQTLKTLGLGLILDMVPNHMGIGDSGNRWWMDVLQYGPGSRFATFFDIRWNVSPRSRPPHVVLPVLGTAFGAALENAELRIVFEDGAFMAAYYDARFPLSPASYHTLLKALQAALPTDGDPEWSERFRDVLNSGFEASAAAPNQPDPTSPDDAPPLAAVQIRLATLANTVPSFASAVSRMLESFNGVRGNPKSVSRLESLLRKQFYRLTFWRTGLDELNYRRFFDISDLAAVRMETPHVFNSSHVLIGRLMREGRIRGLRIDHPDGLWDPAVYFDRLQHLFFSETGLKATDGEGLETGSAPAQANPSEVRIPPQAPPFYVVAEKILSHGEQLPPDWAVHGTTGYDALNQINGLFVDQANRAKFDRIYNTFSRQSVDFPEQVTSNKRRILRTSLASELRSLSVQLKELASGTRHGCDFTLDQLRDGLTEILATFPVYRTYITEQTSKASPVDQDFIDSAIHSARRISDPTRGPLFDFLSDVLSLRRLTPQTRKTRADQVAFIMRFQQLSGPAMAKGLEDTTFYQLHRLASLNEVGGHPDQFGVSPAEFHSGNRNRLTHWPHSMIASATHDTKRGEDLRARLNVLSELPDEWERNLKRWSDLNAPLKPDIGGSDGPDGNDDYLFYQTLLGAWPPGQQPNTALGDLRQRICDYLQKAAREAKTHTTWVEPNAAYEQAQRRFAEAVLTEDSKNRFLEEFLPFQKKIAFLGVFNSLAQTLLKITIPGIPDFYQGTELWDLNLVDPDNRRPVDYDSRRRMLEEIRQHATTNIPERLSFLRHLLAHWETGQIKQFLIHTALQARKRLGTLFASGDYLAPETTGSQAKHLCVHARTDGSKTIITIIPRLIAGLTGGEATAPIGHAIWKDATVSIPVPPGSSRYTNLFTGEIMDLTGQSGELPVPASRALTHFPVALLESS